MEVTEKVLETELSGWVQRMENALAQLKAEEERAKSPVPISLKLKTKSHHHCNLILSRRKLNPLILLDRKIPSRPDVPPSTTPAVSATEVFDLPLPLRHFVSQFYPFPARDWNR